MNRDLARNRYRIVQAVTAVRIPLAIGFGLALPHTQARPTWLYGCLALLLLQELSDLLDGHLARRFGVVSEWGQMFDPFADSVSRLIVYWSLASVGLASAILPLVMALRDIIVAYSRLVSQLRGGSVSARVSGKIKAWVQGLGAIFLLLTPIHALWTGVDAPIIVSWVVLLVTAGSAVEYVVGATSK